jgi:hypothetical protein
MWLKLGAMSTAGDQENMAAKIAHVTTVDVQSFWRHNSPSGNRAGHGRLGEHETYVLSDIPDLSAAGICRLVKAEIVS